LETRQQSGACYACGAALEEAAPALADPDRSPDVATLRRWFERCLWSLCCWVRSCWTMRIFSPPPTILAWDWQVAGAYSDPGGQSGMKDDQWHASRQQPALLEYLEQQGWKTWRRSGREEVAGICPLHRETRPSFYINRRKNVFYCHGCGRGGDLIRLMELLEGLSFAQAIVRLRGRDRAATPLEEAVRFYQRQLPRCPQAQRYLGQRGIHAAEAIARMQIGYALTTGNAA
jgi:hypothetical protein